MKKIVLCALLAGCTCGAYASDGGMYKDWDLYRTDRASERAVIRPRTVSVNTNRVAAQRPCGQQNCGQAFRVKTGTEIIDHYQVYQPVVVYQPAGTYSERRVVNSNPCQMKSNSCY